MAYSGTRTAGVTWPVQGSRLTTLMGAMGVAALGWSLPNTSAATLAQARVAQMDPVHKVSLFAVVSTCGALAAMIMTIVGGALSDRTRSRFGRRTPWIVTGALVSVVGLSAAGSATSLPMLAAGYTLFQAALNASIAGLNAVTADRVPQGKLGMASGIAGLGYLGGLVLGAVTASVLVTAPGRGLWLVAWVFVACSLVFVIVAPDRSSRDLPATCFDWARLLPPRDRDFVLALAGRFLSILALLLFNVYGLFIAQDFLRLPTGRAASVMAVGTAFLGGAALLTTLAGGVVSDRLGRRKPLVAGSSVLMGVGVVPVLVHPSVATLWLFMALAGAGYGAYLSVDAALMVEVLPSQPDAGRDLGFLALGNTAPVVVAPASSAVIVSAAGYPTLFAALAACALLGSAAILMIRKVH